MAGFGRDARVNALIGSGHSRSHYYQLCLPPMLVVWQQAFGASCTRAEPVPAAAE